MEKRHKTSSGRWSVCRFMRTLAYFGVIPFFSQVGWVQHRLGSQLDPVVKNDGEVEDMIFDFRQVDRQSSASLQETWGAVDDVVMGGVSSSRLQVAVGSVVFTGTVSTSNSGGFASVRTRNFEPPFNLQGRDGIQLQIKGDGNRYKFLLRDGVQWDGVAYAYSFDTVADTWMTVDVPFAEMIPVFRARTLDDTHQIDPQQIRAFQFMLSKFEYDGRLNPSFTAGSFELYVRSVATY